MYDAYLEAAAVLWGAAGAFAVREFQRLNRWLFAGMLPPLPIVIGLTAYGKCLGLTRSRGAWAAGAGARALPRITLAPEIFQGNHRCPGGQRVVSETLIHEMVHAQLFLNGLDHQHNGRLWCDTIMRLSPQVLGHAIVAAPDTVRRIDGVARRLARDGALPRRVIASWPHTLRPTDWDPGPLIAVATY
jgi:hypothetical protein